MRNKAFAIALIFLMFLCGCTSVQETSGNILFVDDDGRNITVEAPCERIISLYSAHTENLYALGAGDKMIGGYSTCIYPPEAAKLPMYDYSSDPEKVIAAEPDLVLIRPFITRKSPDFVKAIENAGIKVVSLYPESLEDFDGYIKKLSMLIGIDPTEKLDEFHKKLDDIQTHTMVITPKKRVFFESTDTNIRTVTVDSMAAKAIEFAGAENAAADVKPSSSGSTVAEFGSERVLEIGNEIDIYISQRGAMNSGGNEKTIAARPGFETVKAVREGSVFLINEKIISSPTFRYTTGVKEVARFCYPEDMDDLSEYRTDTAATRRDMANILVRAHHLPVYVPSSSKYYTQEHKGHIYGRFADASWQDKDFDYIETAVHTGSMPWEQRDGAEYFEPDKLVTRYEAAKAVFMMSDFEPVAKSVNILDISGCENQDIVYSVVENGIMGLIEGKFCPNDTLTCQELVEIFLNK